jgi:hypothetical protein
MSQMMISRCSLGIHRFSTFRSPVMWAPKIGVVQIYRLCYDRTVAVHDTRYGARPCW